jgi:hypothetical protein
MEKQSECNDRGLYNIWVTLEAAERYDDLPEHLGVSEGLGCDCLVTHHHSKHNHCLFNKLNDDVVLVFEGECLLMLPVDVTQNFNDLAHKLPIFL